MSCGTSLSPEAAACPVCGTPRNQVGPVAGPPDEQLPTYATPTPPPAGSYDPPPYPGFQPPPPGPYGGFESAPPGPAGPYGPSGPNDPPAPWPPGPPARAGKGRLGTMVVVAGLIATAVVGTLVFQSVSQSGGAGDPEAAVQRLADAVTAEDPVAAIAALDPSEVRTLGEFYQDSQTKAEKLGLTEDDKAFGGVDLTLDGLEYEVEKLGDDVAKVTVTDGRLRWDVETEDFGPLVRQGADEDQYDESGSVDQDELRYQRDGDSKRRDPFIMVVKRNGGWYVSPFFTLAEYVVDIGGLQDGDFDEEMKGKATAESPEDAVRALAEAVEKVDAGEVIDVLASDADVLRAYRDAITEAFESSLADCEDDCADDIEISVDELELSSETVSDDSAKVTISKAVGRANYKNDDGDPAESSFEYDGECISVSVDGDTEEPECFDAQTKRFGFDSAFLMAVKEDGRWAVSPVATYLEYGRLVVESLDDNLVRRVAGTQAEVEDKVKVEFGEAFDAELNDAGWAVYSIDLEAGTEVAIEIDDSSLEDDSATGILYDADGDQVGYDDIVTIDEDGTYTLLVLRDTYAEATVEVTVGEVPSEPIELGKPVTGEVDGDGDVADYTFEGKAGDLVSITIDPEDTLGLVVIDPDGEELFADFDEPYELPSDGTYRVRVSGRFDTPSGDFTLVVEPPPAFTVDGEVPTGPLTGSLAFLSDYSAYEVEVRADQKVTVTVTPDAFLDPGLNVYSENFEVDEKINAGGPGGVETYVLDGSVSTSWNLELVSQTDAAGSFTIQLVST